MPSSPVHAIFYGSNPVATRRLCIELRQRGHIGHIAAALFHVQKCSSRAKVYRGGKLCEDGSTMRYSDLAYCRKGEFLQRLAELLAHDSCGMNWGWGLDLKQPNAKHVLYIDLPQGQVSLHSVHRFAGPDYPGKWDESRASEDRVIEFCDAVWRNGTPARGEGSKGLDT